MSGQLVRPLPGTPGPTLQAAYEALSNARQNAVHPHLIGSTSAEYLAGWFRRAEAPIGATSIKSYRRSLRQEASA